jgi:acetyl-CoA synthetase
VRWSRLYPVNARYQEIGGLVCYPSIGVVPEKVDCTLIATAREAVEPIVRECVAAGVGGAIVFASGYAETGRAERVAEQSRLAAIARESGMASLGPNTVGIVNALVGAAVTFMDITPVPPPAPRAIGLVSQSGALGMALAQAVTRGVSLSHVLTSGNSCDIASRRDPSDRPARPRRRAGAGRRRARPPAGPGRVPCGPWRAALR